MNHPIILRRLLSTLALLTPLTLVCQEIPFNSEYIWHFNDTDRNWHVTKVFPSHVTMTDQMPFRLEFNGYFPRLLIAIKKQASLKAMSNQGFWVSFEFDNAASIEKSVPYEVISEMVRGNPKDHYFVEDFKLSDQELNTFGTSLITTIKGRIGEGKVRTQKVKPRNAEILQVDFQQFIDRIENPAAHQEFYTEREFEPVQPILKNQNYDVKNLIERDEIVRSQVKQFVIDNSDCAVQGDLVFTFFLYSDGKPSVISLSPNSRRKYDKTCKKAIRTSIGKLAGQIISGDRRLNIRKGTYFHSERGFDAPRLESLIRN